MGHTLAIVSMQNQHTTYEHGGISCIMLKYQNCDLGDVHSYGKNMHRGPKVLQ